MPHNPITLLSRDDLDRLHVKRELERARAMYETDPTLNNKARYLRAYRAVLTWVLDEAGLQKPEGIIDEAVSKRDADLVSKNCP
jgi:hypothetical protein